MSQYFTYHCKICNEYADDSMNHGIDHLLQLAEVFPLIRRLYAAIVGKPLDLYLTVEFMAHSSFVQFLCEHDGHELWLDDEYGRECQALMIAAAELT